MKVKTAATAATMEDVRQVISASDGSAKIVNLKILLSSSSTDIARYAFAELKALKAL